MARAFKNVPFFRKYCVYLSWFHTCLLTSRDARHGIFGWGMNESLVHTTVPSFTWGHLNLWPASGCVQAFWRSFQNSKFPLIFCQLSPFEFWFILHMPMNCLNCLWNRGQSRKGTGMGSVLRRKHLTSLKGKLLQSLTNESTSMPTWAPLAGSRCPFHWTWSRAACPLVCSSFTTIKGRKMSCVN